MPNMLVLSAILSVFNVIVKYSQTKTRIYLMKITLLIIDN